MKLNKESLAMYSAIINSPDRVERRRLFGEMFTMYEGGGREIIKRKIRQEFKNPEAIKELEGRLVTINIMKKVIDKMAGVYNESPVRFVVDQNETDKELVELYEDSISFNSIQKETNRHLKMFKKALKELYLDADGNPKAKLIPAHAYEVFNVENPDTTKPDIVCKIIKNSDKTNEQIFHWFTDESFYITDGEGVVLNDLMAVYNNTNGRNPVKALPFIYRTTSTYGIDPIVEDDVLHISIALPIVLTDLLFACKYQCWSLIYTIGVEGSINMNPSSVVSLNYDKSGQKPEIGTIKPQVDSDKVIKLVESILNMFLSSKGLTTGTISTGLNSTNAVSGVSKMLDNAESVEDKKDQQELFLKDENEFWNVLANKIIPYWRRNQMLSAEMNRQFSKRFKVAVVFKEPKVLLTEKERVEMAILKLNNKLTSMKRELMNLNPDFTDDQIEDLIEEILEERERFPLLFGLPAKPKEDDEANDENRDEEEDNGDDEPTPPIKKTKAKKKGGKKDEA